jgi:hydroxymethylbilane synthase
LAACSRVLRIATRQSPLALWQAEHVKALLEQTHPGLAVQLLPMTTAGDQLLDRTLAAAGGKGLFVKELEQALLDGQADLAVHSMKDVPAQLPPGLMLGAFLPGEDPRDAFISTRYARLDELPAGAVVGSASLRRQAQLKLHRPDLMTRALRGNVGTRLRKLDEGAFDAILLAKAGLLRLGLGARVRQTLETDFFLPAIAQGVIGIECRAEDPATNRLLAPLHDLRSATRLAAERALNARLGGNCSVPVAGHAVVRQEAGQQRLKLTALVAAPDGSRAVRDAIEGSATDAAALGTALAERLLATGAREILGALGIHA